MTEKEKAAAGYLYNANYDEELLDEIGRCNDLCHRFNQIAPSNRKAQSEILKQIFGSMGEQVTVNTPFWCDYGYNTSVGDYFFANHNCQILDGGNSRPDRLFSTRAVTRSVLRRSFSKMNSSIRPPRFLFLYFSVFFKKSQ